MEGKMRNIGAIIGNLEAQHAHELMKGMSQAAEDYNVNLLVFPGMHSKSYYDKKLLEHREEFDYQFNTVYDYVEKERVDMLLVSLGTVIDFLGTDNYQEFLAKYQDIPMVIMEDQIQGETCITLDNREGLYQCIKHLIVKHGYRKIAFVSGRKNNFDGRQRLEVYKEIMKDYDLPIEDGMIGYGDFTEYTDEIVGRILDRHPDVEAICFANDLMALGGYRECKRRGLVIGKDIAITGFDDNHEAISYEPPLTTVRVRPFMLGYHAVETALRKLDGEKVESQVMDSALQVRASCGCALNSCDDDVITLDSRQLHADYQRMIKRCKKEAWYAAYVARDTMSYSSNVKEALYEIVYKMKLLGFKSSYIYLFKKPIRNYDNRSWVCPEKMYLAAKQDRNGVDAYEIDKRPYITLAEGIERAIDSQERYTAMHFSLFSNEVQYGLLVCEADLQEASFAYSISLQIGTSLKYLDMMQEQINMQRKLQDSLDVISKKNDLLNHLSVSDELTGLLNRRGIFDAMMNRLEDCPGKAVAIVFIDMDNLKQVNDNFGHNEGDFSLKSIAHILEKSFRTWDPIGRIGGDEFIAYAELDEVQLVPKILNRIEVLTEELNRSCDKPYYIEMSVGVKEVITHPGMDLKDILKEADHVLYKDKKEKRKSCLKKRACD